MREFDYVKDYGKLLTPETVSLLSQIHEFKGKQNLLIEAHGDTLTQLLDTAKIQSTKASNRIENIFTSEERLKKIVLDKTMPKNRDEKEIAGYRDVLSMIHESYNFLPPKPPVILQLHRDLHKYSGMTTGENYKFSGNVIELDSERTYFQLVPRKEAAEAMDCACTALEAALKDPMVDDLMVIPMFILDFLCIHPFNDGNGRLSRLLTLLLLYRSNYVVGKYISIERIIEQSEQAYYNALQKSSEYWGENRNSYMPFVTYLLGVIVAAYREFSSCIRELTTDGLSKPDRIREFIRSNTGNVTKAEIAAKCPDISQITVQRTLIELQKNGDILKIGGGRYTAYTWNREREK